MNKIAFSIIASGSLALLVGVADAEASSTYTIKSGDSLWKVANQHNISLADLKAWNKLSSDAIFPNQVLKVKSAANGSSVASPVSAPSQPISTATNVYIVKSGDTLSKIASLHKTTVSKIQELNKISGSLIFPGQKLTVSASASAPVVSRPAAVAPKPAAATPAPASPSAGTARTHQVVSGDTLSGIAYRNGISVTQLMNWNGLTSSMIRVGQVLKIENIAAVPSAPTPVSAAVPAAAPSTGSAGTYQVVSGDTLSGIAYRNGISVTQLMDWNALTSSGIRVGQVLKIKNTAATPSLTTPVSNPAPVQATDTVSKIVQTAKSLIGTPYAWGGSTVSGFDCSGFIFYVYNQAGIQLPRTSTTGYDSRSYDISSPQVGDLVFFENTYRAGISHMGIYIGGNQFIHAGGDKVHIVSLSDNYWSKHFAGFKRLYAMN